MKKSLFRILLTGAAAAMLSLGANAEFTDVKDNAWYKQYVDYASEKGLVNGVSDGVFSPDSSFTVAQCITVASRIHSGENGKEIPAASGNWYDGSVKYCLDNGIISEGQFDSYDRSITREEAVLVLKNSVAADKLNAINNVSGISDVAFDDESIDEILSFYNAGILGGSDEVGSFMPDNDIKRSEVSAILCRLINKDMRIDVDIPFVGEPRYLIDDVVVTGKWGLQSAWNYNHKYSMDNTTGLESFSIGGNLGQVVDINRPINPVSSGYVVFDTNVTFTSSQTGGYVALRDDEGKEVIKVVSKNDLFVILCGDKAIETAIPVTQGTDLTHTFIFRLDLNNDIASITIDNTTFTDIALKENTVIARLYLGLDGSGSGVLTLKSARCTADYRINENFLSTAFGEGQPLYGDWKTEGNVTLSQILSERNADVYSAKMTDASTAAHSFEKIGAKLCFEANVLMPKADGVRTIALTSSGSEVFKFQFDNGAYSVDGKELRKVTDNVWTHLRVEADCVSKTAFIRINGKDCGTVEFNAESIDGVKLDNRGGVMWFDDIKVYQLFDHDDYPTAPALLEDDGYNIGVNVCNLWRNGYVDEGYDAVAPFPELYPLIGLADEGLPELADWEIKQMAEHGIDFQHICWYSPLDVTTAPIKATSMPQIALNDGYLNSKYGDYVKFCIMWENANASISSMQQFKDYVWPYFVEYYLTDDRYYSIDNKAVMTVWSYKKFVEGFGGVDEAKKAIEFMREDVKNYGYDGMIILFSAASALENYAGIGADGVYPYNYSTDGESGKYQISVMSGMLNNGTIHYVPGISVGFNSIGRHDTRYGLISDEEHEMVCDYIKNDYLPSVKATGEDSWKNNTLIVSTWNEYTEGTYVAPNGYCGFDYLDNIRECFTNAPKEHEDILPSEKVKNRLRSIYPDGFSPIRRLRLEEDENSVNKLKDIGVSVLKWDFSNEEDRAQWRASHGINDFSTTSTSIRGSSAEKDFGVVLNNDVPFSLNVDETGANYLHIRMRTTTVAKSQLYFKSGGSNGMSEAKSVIWETEDTTDFVDYYINLGENALWSGLIPYFRFDPLTQPGEFEIEVFEFMSFPEDTSTVVSFDSTVMTFDFSPVNDDATGEILVTANPRLGFFTMSHTNYEYDIDKNQLYIESLNGSLLLTIGSSKAISNGKEVDLGYVIELRDGLPVLPLKKVMTLLGFSYNEEEGKIDFSTMDDTLRAEAVKNSLASWEFSSPGDMEGWIMENCTGAVSEDYFSLTTTSADPHLVRKNLDINLVQTGFTKIIVGIKYETDKEEFTSQMFFVAGSTKSFTEAASVRTVKMPGSSNGETIEFVFDMSQNPEWYGTLSRLRFDAFNANGTYSVDYIRLA